MLASDHCRNYVRITRLQHKNLLRSTGKPDLSLQMVEKFQNRSSQSKARKSSGSDQSSSEEIEEFALTFGSSSLTKIDETTETPQRTWMKNSNAKFLILLSFPFRIFIIFLI